MFRLFEIRWQHVALSIGLLAVLLTPTVASVWSLDEPKISHTQIPFLKGMGMTSNVVLSKALIQDRGQMYVYKVVFPNLTAKKVAGLAANLGIVAEPVERDEVFLAEGNKESLLAFKFSDTVLYAQDDWISESKPSNLPSPADSIRIATKYLNAKGLQVKGAEVSEVVSMKISVYDTSTNSETSYDHCREVQFIMKIDDYPVVGPGAKVKVAIGENGEVLGVYKAWRQTTPYMTYRIISTSKAVECLEEVGVRCNLVSPEWAVVEDVFLAYYAPPGPERQEYIEPVYVFKGTVRQGDTEEAFEQYIPAVISHSEEHVKRALMIKEGIMEDELSMEKPSQSPSTRGADSSTQSLGCEWVNNYHGYAANLANNGKNCKGLYDRLGGKGWTKQFNYGDDLADEQDFKRYGGPGGGLDYEYADNVDLCMFSGHGSYDYFMFGHMHDDLYLTDSTDPEWGGGYGGGDLEWLIVDACLTLYHDGSTSGSLAFWRWTSVFGSLAFGGLHYMCGFHTTCYDYSTRGAYLGKALTGLYGSSYQFMRNAWWYATVVTEPASHAAAYLRAQSYSVDYSSADSLGTVPWSTYYDIPHLFKYNSDLGWIQERVDPAPGFGTRWFFLGNWWC